MENATQPMQTGGQPMQQQVSGGGSGKKVAIIVVVVVVLLLLVGGYLVKKVVGGIGKTVAEKALEKASGGKADVDLSGGKVTVKGENGNTVTYGNQQLPSDWPSDVPTYSGAKVMFSGSSSANAEGKSASTAIFSSSDSSETVASFYRSQLPSNGWTIKGSTSQANNTTSIVAEKDNRQMLVIVTNADGQTSISLTVGTK